jgi:DNA-binding winged helix-turn-helix (wHTH) protein/predicted negative regulator of RcsB-dependent stress response
MTSSDPVTDEYQLGPFTIKGKENRLVSPESETLVSPKVMAMLLYLCRNSQQVVSFEQIIAVIWPNEVVGDNAIYNLVGQLRKALDDKASSPVYIQTISKVGYRLLVQAVPIDTDSGESYSKPKAESVIEQELVCAADLGTAESHNQPSKQIQIRKWAYAFSLAIAIGLMSIFVYLSTGSKTPSQESQNQLTLAYYQLYRGDERGLNQAIAALQQIAAIEPQWAVPKVELAYAFIRMADFEPTNSEFWYSKIRNIIQGNIEGSESVRLALLFAAIENKSASIEALVETFNENNVLTSARLAYSDLLFKRGLTQQASEQAKLTLETCVDCPYVYRRFAATQVVLGDIESAFDSFARYRMLVSRSVQNPADIAGYVPLNLASLEEMTNWLSATDIPDDLLSHQRNSLALFYLTLGKIALAEAILTTEADTSTQFYDLYTHAAIAGFKGDFATSYALLQKRQTLYPENDFFKLSVVFALWQLGEYQEAKTALYNFGIIDPDTDLPVNMPYPVWSLYAALLIETGNTERGSQILTHLENQFRSGLVIGSLHADIRLSSVLALQGKTNLALSELDKAISQGWVSDFNQSWWNLEDSPYFKNLRANPEFNRIVNLYKSNISSLNPNLVD